MMTAISRKPRENHGLNGLLKSILSLSLLMAIGMLMGERVYAESKPNIQVEFEMDQGPFKFNDLDANEKKQIIDLVCLESQKRWGFLNWCGDAKPQAVWTVRLVVNPKITEPGEAITEAVTLQHILKPTLGESGKNLKENTELYAFYKPKPIRDTDKDRDLLTEKIVQGLTEQFEPLRKWTEGYKYLRTIPLTNKTGIYTKTNGKKYITIPFSLCELQLKKNASFSVDLGIESGSDDSFKLKKIGVVDSSVDSTQKDYIFGIVTMWEVYSETVNPVPTSSANIEGEELPKLLESYEKSVYLDEGEFAIGSICSVDSETRIDIDPNAGN